MGGSPKDSRASKPLIVNLYVTMVLGGISLAVAVVQLPAVKDLGVVFATVVFATVGIGLPTMLAELVLCLFFSSSISELFGSDEKHVPEPIPESLEEMLEENELGTESTGQHVDDASHESHFKSDSEYKKIKRRKILVASLTCRLLSLECIGVAKLLILETLKEVGPRYSKAVTSRHASVDEFITTGREKLAGLRLLRELDPDDETGVIKDYGVFKEDLLNAFETVRKILENRSPKANHDKKIFEEAQVEMRNILRSLDVTEESVNAKVETLFHELSKDGVSNGQLGQNT